MTLPTNEELMLIYCQAQYTRENSHGSGLRGVTAIRDAVLDALIAEAEKEYPGIDRMIADWLRTVKERGA